MGVSKILNTSLFGAFGKNASKLLQQNTKIMIFSILRKKFFCNNINDTNNTNLKQKFNVKDCNLQNLNSIQKNNIEILKKLQNGDLNKSVDIKKQKGNFLIHFFPDIAKEFHPIKNHSIDLSQIHVQSSKNIQQQCKEDSKHIFSCRVSNRTKKFYPTNCSICSRLKGYHNTLLKKFPELVKEIHPDLNKDKPEALAGKYRWNEDIVLTQICLKNKLHPVFKTSIRNRTSIERCKYICPLCFDPNSLQLYKAIPEIYAMLHPTKSKNYLKGSFYYTIPYTLYMRDKVYWLCPICKVESWGSISVKINSVLCVYCHRKRAKANKILLADIAPHLIPEYHSEMNAKELGPFQADPLKIRAKSEKIVYQKCQKVEYHVQRKSISLRAYSKKTKCPYCEYGIFFTPEMIQATLDSK